MSFFCLSFLFSLVSNSTAGSSFRSFSSRRQYAKIDFSRESSIDISFFSVEFFFVSPLSEITIMSMDACGVARQVASTVAERRRRYTRCISLQAAFIRPNCEGTRVKAERSTSVTRDESAKVVIGNRNIFLDEFKINFSLAKISAML